jgi:outer membrane cobalamin receptor
LQRNRLAKKEGSLVTYRALLRALCAAAIIASSSIAARAQSAPTPSPAPQIAHVVTSDRSDEPISAAARTTYVVTKSEMLRHGYLSIADAVADIPGVTLMRYGAGVSQAQIGINGSTSEQVLVLVDGMPAPGAQIEGVDLANFSTDGVQRIEVVEGGGSTLYGSGSIGGIINIITTPLQQSVVTAGTGSFGTNSLSIQTPYLSLERDVATDAYSLPNGTRRPDSDYGLTNLRTGYAKALGKVDARFSAGISDIHQGTPGGDDYLSPTSRQNNVSRDADASFSTTVRATTTTLQLGASSLDLVYSCNTGYDNSGNPIDPNCYAPPQLLTDSQVAASLRADAKHDRSRTVYGVDLSRGTSRVDDGYDPLAIHPFAQTAAYVQQSWIVGSDDSLYAGFRGERDGGQGGAFSPSVGAIVHLSSALSLRANAATAFRAPTADDLYYPYFSNPTLVPERTRVSNVALTQQSSRWSASLNWFSTSGTNLIVDDANYIPQNVGRASIQGVTFAARTGGRTGIYSTLAATDLYREQDLDTNERLPNRGPVLAATLELGYVGTPVSRIESAALTMRNEGPRGYVDTTAPLFDQPAAYSSLTAFVRIRAGAHTLVTLRGFNLGNERYAEIGGYPMPGRTFRLELSSR